MNTTINLTLHAADVWETAEHLRHLADRIDRIGGNAVPEPGEQHDVVINNEIVGTMAGPPAHTAPQQPRPKRMADSIILGTHATAIVDCNAAITGLAQILINAGVQDDCEGEPPVNNYQRGCIEMAIEKLAERAVSSAEWIEEQCAGGGHGDA
ncbi:hypothetical protein [Vreelandella salicampi]|uniref:Uncharacterized protein n=1 Tax=Vreelandella salicampi TaxID=1449798 RepID=A0A7Z0RUS9_9GAMM|nr:hypothetical protein [Halomonas salicampi]NYS60819.1 hypothetical protein [Halomonas salicampi]